jgi:hypothetical protein
MDEVQAKERICEKGKKGGRICEKGNFSWATTQEQPPSRLSLRVFHSFFSLF